MNRRKSGQDVGLSRGISRRWPTTRLPSPRNCALPAPCERSVSSSCVTSTKVSCSRIARLCVWPRPWAERKSDSLRHLQLPRAIRKYRSQIFSNYITENHRSFQRSNSIFQFHVQKIGTRIQPRYSVIFSFYKIISTTHPKAFCSPELFFSSFIYI